MPEEKIRKILKISKEPISMETPIGDDEDSHLGDFIEDQGTLTPADSAIYGNCEFQRHDYSSGEFTFSTFELRLPDAEVEKCEASLGYKLLRCYRGDGWEEKVFMIFTVTNLKDSQDIFINTKYLKSLCILHDGSSRQKTEADDG